MIEVKVYNIKVDDLNKSDSNTKDTYPMVEYQFYGFLMDEIQLVNEQNARLKALTDEMDKTINASQAECRYLKAAVERMTAEVSYENRVQLHVDKLAAEFTQCEVEKLKAEVERLRKAGDAVCESPYLWEDDPAVIAWRAAKEGKSV